jgi:isopentenyl diphosphate isomerase/L-lactate dehydrogenase-like FMN-dependent dehydrogenase
MPVLQEEDMSQHDAAERRQFLKWLSASPLAALPGVSGFAAETPSKLPDPMTWAPANLQELIQDPKDAINVFDFEPVARIKMPPAHFGYMASGIDDEATLRANREAFSRVKLRPRRLVDVSRVDTSVELFGTKWETPIIVAPTGGNKAFHPDGEIAVAKACREKRHLNVLSTSGTTSIEDMIAAKGGPVWYQLYASPSWNVAQAIIKRVEAAGAPVLMITVDRLGGRNQETFLRLRRSDPRECIACHQPGVTNQVRRRPNYDGIDMTGVPNLQSANMTWDFIGRVRQISKMKIVLKGILTHEDARLALANGVDGILVSNHGARGEDNGAASLDSLPEIVDAVGGKMPILFDSGIRRGTDIIKAIAMGASAVCIGRPYLWGLGAFGQPGVEKVLDLLRTELVAGLQQMGVKSLKDLNASHIRRT